MGLGKLQKITGLGIKYAGMGGAGMHASKNQRQEMKSPWSGHLQTASILSDIIPHTETHIMKQAD